jgi:hypothetical protein
MIGNRIALSGALGKLPIRPIRWLIRILLPIEFRLRPQALHDLSRSVDLLVEVIIDEFLDESVRDKRGLVGIWMFHSNVHQPTHTDWNNLNVVGDCLYDIVSTPCIMFVLVQMKLIDDGLNESSAEQVLVLRLKVILFLVSSDGKAFNPEDVVRLSIDLNAS